MPTASTKSDRRSTQTRLDPDVRQMLRDRWAKHGISQSDTVNAAVREYLSRKGNPPKPAA